MEYTYQEYCDNLDFFLNEDNLQESILSDIKGIKGKIGGIIQLVKNTATDLITDTKLSLKDIIKSLKDRDIFSILKRFGFSIKKIAKAIVKAQKFISSSIEKVFIELHKTNVFKKIRAGTVTIDEVLKKYPILKKLSGPIVAGILMYIWLNMTFLGDFDYDMDIGAMYDALVGNFSIEELFGTPQGSMLIALLATGMLSGGALSVAWLGSTTSNLASAIVYASLKKYKKAKPDTLKLLKSKITRKTISENNIMRFSEFNKNNI